VAEFCEQGNEPEQLHRVSLDASNSPRVEVHSEKGSSRIARRTQVGVPYILHAEGMKRWHWIHNKIV
jgi:hypothetical protein